MVDDAPLRYDEVHRCSHRRSKSAQFPRLDRRRLSLLSDPAVLGCHFLTSLGHEVKSDRADYQFVLVRVVRDGWLEPT